jgi:hypothetical protein
VIIELRGELDPAPIKRTSTRGYIEMALTGHEHAVTIDGYDIRISIASGNTATSYIEGGTYAGLITVLSTTESENDIDSTAEAMMVAATRVSDAIRVKQPNVGLVGQPPEFVSFAVRKDGGTWGSYNYWPPSRPWYINQVVEADFVVTALERDLGLTDRLLAQATFWSLHAAASNPQTAVLLAAIACESHAKSTFQTVLSGEGNGGIGEVMFDKTPPTTFSAADLYSRVALAIVGQSLKDADKSTFRALEKLFQLRNKVAHTGELGAALNRADSLELAQNAVRAARKSVYWLNGVVVAR